MQTTSVSYFILSMTSIRFKAKCWDMVVCLMLGQICLKLRLLSLNGRPQPEWINFLRSHNITQWHDYSSQTPMRYLGFPLVQSMNQCCYLEGHLQMVRSQCHIYSQRRLSLWGKVTIVNSLILSKIWLRSVKIPLSSFKQLRSIVYQFVWKDCNPKIKYATLCQPLKKGGLGLLDSHIQYSILQYRWISYMLDINRASYCSNLL